MPPRAQVAHQQATYLFDALRKRMDGRPVQPFAFKDLGPLVSPGHFGAVGSLVGGLTGGSMFIEGLMARLMYTSLYHIHVLALYGWVHMSVDMIMHQLRSKTNPCVKLHQARPRGRAGYLARQQCICFDRLTASFTIIVRGREGSAVQLDAEVKSLIPGRSFDRRGFMKMALGSAFAAAVLPVSAQTIHTNFNGLTVGEVTMPVGDFKMPAYRAQPEGKTKLPVVIVTSEISGVHEYIADICRCFAKLGYLAIAPELFVRQGDPRAYGTVQETVANMVPKMPDSQVAGDIDATIAWTTESGGDATRIGITGFCWGGRQVWLTVERNPGIKAAVARHGPLKGNPNPLQPVSLVDRVDELKAPVSGLYGAKDTVITGDARDAIKVTLKKSRNPKAHVSRTIVYPNSGHAFHTNHRPSYMKADAEDGWKECLAWFKDHGVV